MSLTKHEQCNIIKGKISLVSDSSSEDDKDNASSSNLFSLALFMFLLSEEISFEDEATVMLLLTFEFMKY